MKYIKFFLLVLTISLSSALSSAAITGDWKVYGTFDNNVQQIVDTPETLFFTALPQPYNKTIASINEPLCFLFAMDKSSGELRAVTIRDNLTEPLVRKIAYNPIKKYLLVIYDNLNIDFIYDNGKIENVAGLMNSNLPGLKDIYNITFDNDRNGVYVGTEFGYIRLDDKKHEIAESRNYGTPVWSAIRVGDKIMLSDDMKVYVALEKDPRFALSEYTVIEKLVREKFILPADDTHFFSMQGNNKGEYSYMEYMKLNDDFSISNRVYLGSALVSDVTMQEDGYTVLMQQEMMKMNFNGTRKIIALQPSDKNKSIDSYDFKTFWKASPREGLMSYDYSDGKWTVKSNFTIPNGPSTFMSQYMVHHPKYGMLVPGRGLDTPFSSEYYVNIPPTISALKDGNWSDLSPLWKAKDLPELGYNFFGLAIDPDDPKYVYRGSFYNGIIRYNLENPSDVLQFSRSTDDNASRPWFISLRPPLAAWSALFRMYSPQFDNNKNLLSIFNDADNQKIILYRWSPENRKATKDASTYRPFDVLTLPIMGSNADKFIVLKHKNNANKIVISAWGEGKIYVIDHNGTFDTTADDKITSFGSLPNQDGTVFSMDDVACLYEDPETGLVWVGCRRGLFTFNPITIYNNKVINQIKVSRNDGTSLADYLLNEVYVYNIQDDGQGRKWFSTNGAGLVATSSDGRKVLGEFTRENSYIPDNLVYSSAYNPDTRSILVSTDKGLAEFFPAGSSSNNESSSVRAYPNPVAPDYYGFVTIDNVPDNSFIKIVDAQGEIVADLGIAEGGYIQWDVTGMDKRRVKTGVYYILVSASSSSDSAKSQIGKILVMN